MRGQLRVSCVLHAWSFRGERAGRLPQFEDCPSAGIAWMQAAAVGTAALRHWPERLTRRRRSMSTLTLTLTLTLMFTSAIPYGGVELKGEVKSI